MIINFCIGGRLGNAIFRYMASAIMCMCYNGIYSINNHQPYNCDDKMFLQIIKPIINTGRPTPFTQLITGINMIDYYQHDLIYKMHKSHLLNFIQKNPSHYVLTDGINSGDQQCEKFYMMDIICTPPTFTKRYKNVLHIRLEDFVTHGLYLKVDRILALLDKNILHDSLCIVCKKPVTNFENLYIREIIKHAFNKKIRVFLEYNDTLTDYYIMKESELLICSKSTLSWCAAFFSDKIKKCYLPEYDISPNSTCKSPIDNSELY